MTDEPTPERIPTPPDTPELLALADCMWTMTCGEGLKPSIAPAGEHRDLWLRVAVANAKIVNDHSTAMMRLQELLSSLCVAAKPFSEAGKKLREMTEMNRARRIAKQPIPLKQAGPVIPPADLLRMEKVLARVMREAPR